MAKKRVVKKRPLKRVRQSKPKKVSFQPKRNILDPAYIKWRDTVYTRDKYRCRWCNRKSKIINAHHIRRWADFPSLRFMVSNGITLCKKCHEKVKNKEDQYAQFFFSLLSQALLKHIKNVL